MRIYYDEARKNIVLGATTRLFASSSLVAQTDRGRVSVIYRANNFRELYIKHNQVLREDGSPAGATISAVIDYLNGEFNKTPYDSQSGTESVPTLVVSTFTVQANTQVLFSEQIDLEAGAEIILDGVLVEVS